MIVEGAKAGVLVAWGGGRGKAVVLVDGGAEQKCEGDMGGIKAGVVAAGTKG